MLSKAICVYLQLCTSVIYIQTTQYLCSFTDWSPVVCGTPLKDSLSTHSPGSPGHALHVQVVFTSFPPLVFFPLAFQTLHIFTLRLYIFPFCWSFPLAWPVVPFQSTLLCCLLLVFWVPIWEHCRKGVCKDPTSSTEKHFFLLSICTVYVMRVHNA